MRLGAIVVVVAGLSLIGATAPPARSADRRIVPCGGSIGTVRFPYLGNSRPADRYRQVLGTVSVPPAYMRQVVPTNERRWGYWHKQGLVVGATGQSVTVTVPRQWRSRAAIAWGVGVGPTSSLRIEGCGASAGLGLAYAGGFYLRSSSACVPLVFSVGRRSTTIRFGVGQRCRG